MAAAFKPLEKIRAAETYETLPCARKIVHHVGFSPGTAVLRRAVGLSVVGAAIARVDATHGRCPRLCQNTARRIDRPGRYRGCET